MMCQCPDTVLFVRVAHEDAEHVVLARAAVELDVLRCGGWRTLWTSIRHFRRKQALIIEVHVATEGEITAHEVERALQDLVPER